MLAPSIPSRIRARMSRVKAVATLAAVVFPAATALGSAATGSYWPHATLSVSLPPLSDKLPQPKLP